MKKFAIVFLSLCLVVSLPFAAHANIVTATGKYLINAIKHAPGGAQVNATNTVTGAKHVIKHGVSSADLGKSIGAGIVGMGVATGVGFAFQAITGLALDAVDWVLDPANNAVKVTPVAPPQDVSCSASGYHVAAQFGYYATKEAACKATLSGFGYPYVQVKDGQQCQFIAPSGVVGSYNIQSKGAACTTSSPDYIKPIPPPPQYISLDALAAKTLELADAGNAAAQKDVEDHVAHKAQNGDLDNELDNAPDITQPENPQEPAECPAGFVKADNVCVKIDLDIEPGTEGGEPLFCDSSEFTKKVCDWIDWTQTEHDEPDAGKVDIKDKSEDLSIDNDRIDFSNQCPAPTPINTSVGGFPVSTELNYQPLCDFFTMLNPFVVGMGGISSALIIAGGARRG